MGLEDQTEVGSSSGPSAASIKVFLPHERPVRVYRGEMSFCEKIGEVSRSCYIWGWNIY